MARSKTVIGLDIGTSSVKLVHFTETKKGIHLLDCAAEALPRDAIVDGQLMNATAVVETVRHLVEKRKLKTKDVAVSISGRSVIIKKISLPDMDRNALDDTIKWEAEQHIPFDINDVYLAYEILQRRPEQGQMDVLLVAAKQEVVEERADVVRDAGLTPVIVDVDCFAVQNAFEASYGTSPGESVVLIDVGDSMSNINIVSNGMTTFTRDIGIGGQHFTEELRKRLNISVEQAQAYKVGGHQVEMQGVVPQEVQRILRAVCDNMAAEIHRSLDFFLATSSEGRVSRIYLSGGTAQIGALTQTMENRIGVEVEVLDPLRGLKVNGRQVDLDLINRIRPSLAVAVGLGLRKQAGR